MTVLLFNVAVSTVEVMQHKIRLEDGHEQLARIWKEVVMACFNVMSWHLPGEM
jgi:hypothetical protein